MSWAHVPSSGESEVPEVVAFLEELMMATADEATDLLTNAGDDVLDRWHERAREGE